MTADLGVLIVDGANVVGSRPDGWWKDRAAAAARLHHRLQALGSDHEAIVLVLEGRARPGVPEGSAGGIRTVHAAADGDDTIVAVARAEREAGRAVTVVTADRGLVSRLVVLGVEDRRPSWLLARLPTDPGARD